MNVLINFNFFGYQLLMSTTKRMGLKYAKKLKYKNEIYFIIERTIKTQIKKDKDMLTQKIII